MQWPNAGGGSCQLASRRFQIAEPGQPLQHRRRIRLKLFKLKTLIPFRISETLADDHVNAERAGCHQGHPAELPAAQDAQRPHAEMLAVC